MAISLQKGQRVSLSKEGGLKNILIGLGWDINKYDNNATFDLDIQAFLLGKDGKINKDSDFIFYNNLIHPSKAVEHLGDNLTGDSDGDDEQIIMNLDKVPNDIEKVAITITIHEAEEKMQTFGQVDNAYVRVVNSDDNQEYLRYDLTENYSIETSVVACEIYKNNGDWKFNALGSGKREGLKDLCNMYGVNVG